MIKLLKPLIFSFLILSGLFCFSGKVHANESVCFKDVCFYPEIARSQAEKEKGLMRHEKLAVNGGMLFVYTNEGRRSFWMKNMRMSLDFVWMDQSGKIVNLHEQVPACEEKGECPALESKIPVQYVLEITAGAIQKTGIKIGDQAIIHLGKSK